MLPCKIHLRKSICYPCLHLVRIEGENLGGREANGIDARCTSVPTQHFPFVLGLSYEQRRLLRRHHPREKICCWKKWRGILSYHTGRWACVCLHLRPATILLASSILGTMGARSLASVPFFFRQEIDQPRSRRGRAQNKCGSGALQPHFLFRWLYWPVGIFFTRANVAFWGLTRWKQREMLD